MTVIVLALASLTGLSVLTWAALIKAGLRGVTVTVGLKWRPDRVRPALPALPALASAPPTPIRPRKEHP